MVNPNTKEALFRWFTDYWFPLIWPNYAQEPPYPWQIEATRLLCHGRAGDVLALVCRRRTGKTTWCAAIIAGLLYLMRQPRKWDFWAYDKPYKVMVAGFEGEQAKKVYTEVGLMVRQAKLAGKTSGGFAFKDNPYPLITCGSATCIFRSTSDQKGKNLEGDYYALIFMIEAGFHARETFSNSLMPMLSDCGGQMILDGKLWGNWHKEIYDECVKNGRAISISTVDPQISQIHRDFAESMRPMMTELEWETEFGSGWYAYGNRFFNGPGIAKAGKYPGIGVGHPIDGHWYKWVWDGAQRSDHSDHAIYDVTGPRMDRVWDVSCIPEFAERGLQGDYISQGPKVIHHIARFRPYKMSYDATTLGNIAISYWREQLASTGMPEHDFPMFEPMEFRPYSTLKRDAANELGFLIEKELYGYHPTMRRHKGELEQFGFSQKAGGTLVLEAITGHDDTVTTGMMGVYQEKPKELRAARYALVPGSREWFNEQMKVMREHEESQSAGMGLWRTSI